MRKRLTNDNPTSNTETMLNLAYAKDGNVYLRYGVDDINLCDYVSDLATNKGCNYTSNEIMEGACLECDCCVNLLYCLAVQAAELRERLKHYEDLEEQGQLFVPPCKVGDTVYVIKRCRCGKPENYDLKTCGRKVVARTPKVLARVMLQETGKRLKPNYTGKIEYEVALKGTICYSVYEKQFVLNMLTDIGKKVFITKEEAEKALEMIKFQNKK